MQSSTRSRRRRIGEKIPVDGGTLDVAYRIEYDPETQEHLAVLSARDVSTVLDTVLRQLVDQPSFGTRNRKKMRPNPVAPWELRIGRLRVYYDVQDAPEPIVTIRAIGVKDRNRVRIGGQEIEL